MSNPIEQTTLPDYMSTDQSLARAVLATVDYLAWQADKAKIAELTEKVKELEAQTLSSKARKAQRNEEKKRRVEEFSERLRQWDLSEKNRLERDVNKAELETAEWKKKYQERIDQEKTRAFGVSFALHEANEKLKENNVVIEHMKAELVKARNQAMGIIDPPVAANSGIHPTSTTSPPGSLSDATLCPDSISGSAAYAAPSPGSKTNQTYSISVSATEEAEGQENVGAANSPVADHSGVHPSTEFVMSTSGSLSTATIGSASLPSSATAHIAPSSGSKTNQLPPISASATEAIEGIDASYRILELELKLALAKHRLGQATSLATEHKQIYEETAKRLRSAKSEIVTLRKRLDNLSSEIYLARAGQSSATLKLWNEGTKRRPMAVEISRTNHQLQSLLNETRKVLELGGDVLRGPIKQAVSGTPPVSSAAGSPPGKYINISPMDIHNFIRLSLEKERFQGFVEEAEKYLRQVRMDALKWDSDHDETPEDEEAEEGVGEDPDVFQGIFGIGGVNGVPAQEDPDADVSDFNLDDSD